MRSKMVKRYWCDHCNKAGLSAGHMVRHEQHCTMNPARSCRVCKFVNGTSGPGEDGLKALIALLPTGDCPSFGDELNEYVDVANAAVTKLRGAADGCPACMLAALRQAKISVGMVSETFDFSAEMKAIFADLRSEEWPY